MSERNYRKLQSDRWLSPPILAILIFFLAIVVFAYLYSLQEGKGIELRVNRELEGVARLKVNQIHNWRSGHLQNGEILTGDIPLTSRMKAFISRHDPGDSGADIISWMKAIAHGSDYSRIRLYDASRNVRLSFSKSNLKTGAEFTWIGTYHKSTFTDLHRDDSASSPHMELIVPLNDVSGQDTLTRGYVVFQIDPDQFLYPLVLSWPTFSKTAECLLFHSSGKDVLYLSELRYRKNSAVRLKLPINSDPQLTAALALKGETGIVNGRDYRGSEVMACISRIPGSPWYLIAKIDREEIDAPRQELWKNFFIGLMLLVILAYVTISLAWRKAHAKYFRNLYELEKEQHKLSLTYQHLTKNANEIILICNTDLSIKDANTQALKVFGYSLEEMLKHKITDFETNDPDPGIKIGNPGINFHEGIVIETILKKKDGTAFFVELSAQEIEFDETNQVFFIIRDITERKAAENALIESERRYRSLFLNMQEGYAYCRMFFEGDEPVDFRYLEVNDKFGELTGLKGVEGKMASEAIPGINRLDDQLFKIYGKVAKTGVPEKFEFYVQALSMWFSISVYSPQQDYFVSVFDVITERKNAEQRIRKSEELLRESQRVAAIGHYEMDTVGGVWTSSVILDDIFGIDPDYFKDVRGWVKIVHPEDRERMLEYFTTHVVKNRNPFDMEYRIIRWNDNIVRWVHGLGQLQFNPDGDVVKMFGTIQDITSYKKIEEALKQQNEEMTHFIYTVSHDLKSPLVTIRTFLGYLEQDMAANDKSRLAKDMEYIRTATDKMSMLLDEILALSRIGRKKNPFAEVGLETIIREALSMVAGQVEERGVKLEFPDKPVVLFGDHQRLVDVFQNLLDNSVKFMGDQPNPLIKINARETEDAIIVVVKDNGVGIEPEYQQRIFNIFEKLDPKTEGTGVGLAIVQRVIEIHGGKTWIESDGTGTGMSVCFALPKKKNRD
jgi:PAS domain S-box-containing protein